MRKIIVVSFITLDGVMQAPGGPDEDPSNGFAYGGWVAPHSDEVSGKLMRQQMAPTDILLGRKTYDNFAGYWPQNAQIWPGINEVTKYVLSNTINQSDWENTEFLTSLADIEKLKNAEGGDIKVWGSGELVRALLKHDLADELWLKIHPVILGKGKNLFSAESSPAGFTLFKSAITPSGVIFASYKRSGEVKTGAIGA
ncbi:dihydrofolate reductase family protein [Mucilaginibacter psychrotolerans]|uniref:Dihydrofolate reductase n=1 Tax=Mucilaginibacter psychrotolerans TaxID=1524096 RepID=A0A4Y8SAS1_9SPHI|nr:dihydrofolate reductase family protein [Mucilaginibacter psychrotolerans]TFF35657.1 dihydrofolate reductase [Mucilaginibacter psychrotolerans]